MRAIRRMLVVPAVFAVLAPAAARASSGLPAGMHECQHPVVTGVEVYGLKGVRVSAACPVALALFRWEPRHGNAGKLYGCHRKHPTMGGTPYLKLHSFDGWHLSLTGRYKSFTMSRGTAAFKVTGTDFPLNCS